VSYDLTVEPMRDETGEVVGLACAALDVSEYVGERRDLELVLERISDAFFALDRDWRFTYVNDRAAELLDRRAEALVGERVWEAFPEAADSTFRRQYERAMETQETVTFAEYYPPLSTWFEVRAYPSETGLSVYFRDVTAAKEREREQAERRRLFETLGDTLAHDACTPIASLRGRLELARSDENPEEHLEAAERSLDRLETLVEEFADVMREGGAVTDVREVDLGATAERVWESFETPAATLRFEADGTIRADEDALARLLQNLFRNSVEHGSPGTRAAGEAVEDGNQVTVTVGLLGDDGFYVDDDGPGVPPDRREAVFDPGETSKPDGTGFGLVGVRQIALAHGWRLQLTENEAGGARFEFRRVEGVDAAAGTTA
jgi:PAS domain S-box-containing protein